MKGSSDQKYSFDGFTLDLPRGCLFRGEQAIRLRPKSFEVLAYLAANSGRLVTKSELMTAIWPDSFVTDDSLVQCLIDVRRALGDDSQQLIKTVPRRGYIFDREVKLNEAPARGPVYEERIEGFKVVIENEDSETVPLNLLTKRLALPGRRTLSAKLLALAVLSLIVGGGLWMLMSGGRGGPSSKPRTLAILPFKPISTDPGDQYLGLGMADALITKLGSASQIVVRPTAAVRKYAGLDRDAAAAGRELQVDSVLNGSIQRSDKRVRVTIQLVSVEDGKPLWTEKLDENFTDIFAIEDSISEKVASALTLKLTGAEKTLLTKHPTKNAEAYQLYLKGRYHWNKRTPEDVTKGIEYFKQAIAKDQNYALAYAGLADCYAVASSVSGLSPDRSLPEAKAAAMRALEIDDALAEAHATLGFVRLYHDWDWAGAEQEFKKAIELNPNYPTSHHWYSNLLVYSGRNEVGFKEIERAQELDPVSPMINEVVGWHRHLARLEDEAITLQQKAIDLEPNFAPSHFGLGTSYEQKGMYEQAIAEFKKAISIAPDDLEYITGLGHLYAVMGKRDEARLVVEQLKRLGARRYVSAHNFALIYAGLGEKDLAFEWLEKAYEERANSLPRIKVEPRFDSLHSDARFQDLLRRIGLP